MRAYPTHPERIGSVFSTEALARGIPCPYYSLSQTMEVIEKQTQSEAGLPQHPNLPGKPDREKQSGLSDIDLSSLPPVWLANNLFCS
jgi:hypothetical protein